VYDRPDSPAVADFQSGSAYCGCAESVMRAIFGGPCEEEMAMSVDDVMRRRTSLALSRFGGPEIAGVCGSNYGDVHGMERGA